MYQYILTEAVLGISACIDIRYRRVYRWTAALYLSLAVLGHLAGNTAGISDMVYGMLPGIFCLVVSRVSGQALGYGDSILIVVCGVSFGARLCLYAVFSAFFWAGIWALVLLLFRRADRKRELAFIPFLFLGTAIQGFGAW